MKNLRVNVSTIFALFGLVTITKKEMQVREVLNLDGWKKKKKLSVFLLIKRRKNVVICIFLISNWILFDRAY